MNSVVIKLCVLRRIFHNTLYKCKIHEIRAVTTTTCNLRCTENVLNLETNSNNCTSTNKFQKLPRNYFRVIGGGYFGAPRSLNVVLSSKRYVFNCGEGTQRRIPSGGKRSDVFVTYNNWENIGGLIGLALTWQSSGLKSLRLHGPPKIEELFQICEGFIDPPWQIKFEKFDHSKEGIDDKLMKVHYVPLFKTNNMDININGAAANFNINKGISNDISIAYICKIYDNEQKFRRQGDNQNEERVVLDDGTTFIHKPIQPILGNPTFIVIECPTEEFLDSLLEAKEFMPFYSSSSSSNKSCNFIDIIVHFTPVSVMKHPKYLEWMKRFPNYTCHLLINELSKGIVSTRISCLQHQLRLLHSDIFPILNCEQKFISNSSYNHHIDIPNMIIGSPNLLCSLTPKLEERREFQQPFNFAKYANAVCEISGFKEQLQQLNESLGRQNNPLSDEKYPEITFLGTGASGCAVFRNATSILITLSPDCYLLLDCGEGTFHQLIRLFGINATMKIIKNLKAIFISHLHPDHHLGLIKILLERERLLKKKKDLYLLAPTQINDWLRPYEERYENILDTFKFISNSTMENNEAQARTEHYLNLLSEAGLKEITTVRVLHWCDPSFGIVLTLDDGRKLVYSGDTMPCDDLIAEGKNCDVLIHEATFDESLAIVAEKTMHSTTSGAIEVGKKMEAKFTLLTHFSQRYPYIPYLDDKFDNFVGIAFDNMQLSWKNIHLTSNFTPLFKLMFHKSLKYLEEKIMKRNMKIL